VADTKQTVHVYGLL